jgi:hypothetical protein
MNPSSQIMESPANPGRFKTPLDRFFEDRYRHEVRGIRLQANELNWGSLGNHYSRVQKKGHAIVGFQGQISFTGEVDPFVPYFQLGQHLNVGKHTISGMGRFEVLS